MWPSPVGGVLSRAGQPLFGAGCSVVVCERDSVCVCVCVCGLWTQSWEGVSRRASMEGAPPCKRRRTSVGDLPETGTCWIHDPQWRGVPLCVSPCCRDSLSSDTVCAVGGVAACFPLCLLLCARVFLGGRGGLCAWCEWMEIFPGVCVWGGEELLCLCGDVCPCPAGGFHTF